MNRTPYPYRFGARSFVRQLAIAGALVAMDLADAEARVLADKHAPARIMTNRERKRWLAERDEHN